MLKIQVQFALGQPFYDIPLLDEKTEPASLKDESNNTMLIMKAYKKYADLLVVDLNKVKAPEFEANVRLVNLFDLNPNNFKHEVRLLKGEKYERVFKSQAGKGKLIMEQV